MSIYETEQASKKQGFFFAVELIQPTWEQFGYVMWSTEAEAIASGERSVKEQRAHGYRVHYNTLGVKR